MNKEFELVGKDINYWKSIWYKPRIAAHNITERHNFATMLYVEIIMILLFPITVKRLPISGFDYLIGVVIGAFALFGSLFLWAIICKFIARLAGGRIRYLDAVDITVGSGLFYIAQCILVVAHFLFTSHGIYHMDFIGISFLVLGYIFGIWGFVTGIIMLSEISKANFWKLLIYTIVALIIIFVVLSFVMIILIAIAFFIAMVVSGSASML